MRTAIDNTKFRYSTLIILFCCILSTLPSFGQSSRFVIDDLSHFIDPGKSWQTAGNIFAELDKPNKFKIVKGTGILVNQPMKRKRGQDIITREQFGSIDLDLEFMMAKESNSGIFFMGLYEIQLKDSWGAQFITSADNGGVSEQWDAIGQVEYPGSAPRQNVSKGPGLWQHLKVSFQAPLFDEEGQKIQNAKFLRVELNGVTIQENVELFGPAKSALSSEEKSTGPLQIQGDHGAVALRNIEITRYGKPRPELKDLRYTIYQGRFNDVPSYDSLPPEIEGPSVILTSKLRTKSNQFLIRYTGKLDVKEAGEYKFRLHTPGGAGFIKIGDKEIIPLTEWGSSGIIDLKAGVLPFELLYSKFEDWVEPDLGLKLAGPGIREYLVSDGSGNFETTGDPIFVEADKNTLLRSFMDLPFTESGLRLSHAVSVGSPLKIHYTYDMNKGAIAQLWRGGFLDATPMWYSRGDGSSRPIGAVQYFGIPEFTLAKLNSLQNSWPTDTTGSHYRPVGYQLDKQDQPSFLYEIYGSEVQDAIRVLENANGVQRTISVQNASDDFYVLLGRGNKIETVSKDIYLIDDKSYYLRIEDSGEGKPAIREIAGQQELLIPVRNKLVYSILF